MSDLRLTARQMFEKAKFIQWMGAKLDVLENGRCETSLDVKDDFLQQHGFIHAGIIATLADHSAGGAAGSLCASDEGILTIEFKVNFIRTAKCRRLFCVAETLKKGRTVAVVESSVYCDARKSREDLVAKAQVTLAVLQVDLA